MRLIGNGNMIIKCTNRQDIRELKKAAEATLYKYKIMTTKMMKRRIKIPGYEGDKSEMEIERTQNT